jgi:hypothetical protein
MLTKFDGDAEAPMPGAEVKPASGRFGRALALVGRMLGWGVLAAVSGLILGLLNGVVHNPPDVPGDELANEWYTVGVIIIMVVESVVGFLIGAAIAIIPRTAKGRRHAFGFALVGALLAIGLAWILARVFHIVLFDWRDGSELVSCMALQAAGAIVGISYAVSREPRPIDADEQPLE